MPVVVILVPKDLWWQAALTYLTRGYLILNIGFDGANDIRLVMKKINP